MRTAQASHVEAYGTRRRDGSRAHFRLARMSNVVEMNAPARRKRRSSRTALVLGGGGFTGGVYQIGALRALDLLSSNRSVNQFDIYVGTSAGSLIASLAANGVTPEQMMRTVNDQVPSLAAAAGPRDAPAPQQDASSPARR